MWPAMGRLSFAARCDHAVVVHGVWPGAKVFGSDAEKILSDGCTFKDKRGRILS